MKIWLSVIATLFILTGCSGANDSSDKKEVTGSLLKVHNGFFSQRNQNYLSQKCDVDLKQQKISLFKDLEKRSSALIELSNKYYTEAEHHENFQVLKFGPARFYIRNDIKNHEDKWQLDDPVSWINILNFYSKTIKENNNFEAWYDLNKMARGILADDQDRLNNKLNLSLKREDIPILESAIAAVGICAEDESCTDLNLPLSIEEWMKQKRYYPKNLSAIRESQGEEFRRNISVFYKELKYDMRKLLNIVIIHFSKCVYQKLKQGQLFILVGRR